jgi:hypothetical protein
MNFRDEILEGYFVILGKSKALISRTKVHSPSLRIIGSNCEAES